MGKGNKNKSLIVKLICILLSFGLWLYISNVENPVRSYELKGVPVEVTNQGSVSDANLAIISDQNFTVDLRLEGASSELSKTKIESFKLIADMGAYALKNGENLIPIQVVSCPENINIKNNGFLGLKLKLEQLKSKEITLNSKVNLYYNNNVYKKDLSISPQIVKISGPQSSVDRVNEGVLIGEMQGIEKDTQKQYGIKFLDINGKEVTNINSNYNTAELSVKVSNGKSVPINIKTSGELKQGLSIASMDSNLKEVHIIGESEILNKVTSIDTLDINLADIDASKEVSANLNIPKGVVVQPNNEAVKIKFVLNKDEIITKDISCKVEYINLPNQFILDAPTENINISISGLKSKVDNFNLNDIKTVVDLANISNEGSFKYMPIATISDNAEVSVASVNEVNISVKKKV